MSAVAELDEKAYKALFKKGQKFRVIKAGAKISGMVPIAPWTQQGFRRELEVGDVLTCRGSSMTAGDGVPAIKWADEKDDWICNDPLFYPQLDNGMWTGQYPARGYLEPIDENQS